MLVPPFTHNGVRYLVSGGGETHWVRNLRAAGAGELRRGRTREQIQVVEITGEERDRVVAAYRDAMGPRASAYFAALPNLEEHAVFRVDPVTAAQP